MTHLPSVTTFLGIFVLRGESVDKLLLVGPGLCWEFELNLDVGESVEEL